MSESFEYVLAGTSACAAPSIVSSGGKFCIMAVGNRLPSQGKSGTFYYYPDRRLRDSPFNGPGKTCYFETREAAQGAIDEYLAKLASEGLLVQMHGVAA